MYLKKTILMGCIQYRKKSKMTNMQQFLSWYRAKSSIPMTANE